MKPLKPRLMAVTVNGYTSIREAEVKLGDLNVLVGANGSGQLLHYPGGRKIELGVISERNDYRAVLIPTQDDDLLFEGEWTTYRNAIHGGESTRVIGRDHQETALHGRASERGPGPSVERYVIDLPADRGDRPPRGAVFRWVRARARGRGGHDPPSLAARGLRPPRCYGRPPGPARLS